MGIIFLLFRLQRKCKFTQKMSVCEKLEWSIRNNICCIPKNTTFDSDDRIMWLQLNSDNMNVKRMQMQK